MKLLALETSAKAASAALFDGNTLLAESYQNAGLTHSRTLLAMVQAMLDNCSRSAGDVEAVAVASGPGSFTGIRIGVAAAKGFAWGRELPLYGVSTLEAMAMGLGLMEGLVCPVMDARRDQVYTALFQAENGQLTRLMPDCAISLPQLGSRLAPYAPPVTAVGDGAALACQALDMLRLPPEHRRMQRASGVGLAAMAAMARGEAPDGAIPHYLRLSQAERERLRRENGKG